MPEPQTPPIPSSLPVLPLRRTVAFPLTLQPLAVNRPASIESVNRFGISDRVKGDSARSVAKSSMRSCRGRRQNSAS